MKKFLSSVQFITILPFGKTVEFDPRGMVQYFPVVGLLVGFILCLCDMVFMSLWPAHVVAVLDVLVLLIVTGAFHIDGIGDAADGLFSHRSKEKALLIMKDSRVGVMGLVAVVSILAVKWGGIMSLDAHRSLFLLIIPAYARGSMIFGIKFLEYGRPDGGTGHALFEKPLENSAFLFLSIPVALSLFAGIRGIYLIAIYLLLVFLTIRYYKRMMGCITGDMLGAMTEFIEAFLFLLVAAGGI